MLTGSIERASVDVNGVQDNGGASYAQLNADGTIVSFSSGGTNLVPNDTNGAFDVFHKNLQTGAIQIASADVNGVLGNSASLVTGISTDGRFVSFTSIKQRKILPRLRKLRGKPQLLKTKAGQKDSVKV